MFRNIRQLLPFLILLLLPCVSASAETSCQITNYSMSVNILSDGDAQICEMLVYDFDGSYDSIPAFFPAERMENAENMSIFIDGQALNLSTECTLIQEDGFLHLNLSASGRSDTRLVTFEYRLSDIAQRYEDTGVIEHRLIPSARPLTLRNASVTVRFENGMKPSSVQAFVHGGMDSSLLSVSADGVRAGTADVYADDFVELHILFPAELIGDASIREGQILAAHLEAERQLNAEEIHRLSLIRTIKYTFSAVYCTVFLLIYLLMAKKYKLKRRTSRSGNASRLSCVPAAFAHAVLNEAPDTDALCGTLCELIKKGTIKDRLHEDEPCLERISSEQLELYPHQSKLLDRLFASSDVLLIFQMHAQGNQERAAEWEACYTEYCSQVTQDMYAFGLTHQNEGLLVAFNALAVLCGVAGAGYILLAGESIPLLGIFMLLMIFFLLRLTDRVCRLTDKGEALERDAVAFREQGFTEEHSDLLPHAASLALIKESERSNPQYEHIEHLRIALRDAHNHNASLPR